MKRSPIKRKRTGKPRRRAGGCREYLDWLKEQKCCVTKLRTGQYIDSWFSENTIMRQGITVDPAHVRTKRLGGDLYNAVPLAHHLHEEQHRIGIKSFQAKYGIDLTEIARNMTEKFLAESPCSQFERMSGSIRSAQNQNREARTGQRPEAGDC